MENFIAMKMIIGRPMLKGQEATVDSDQESVTRKQKTENRKQKTLITDL